MRKKSQGDVQWYLPNKKRPFFRSTLFAKYSIREIARQFHRENQHKATIKELRNCFYYKCEETEILDSLIDKGFGDYFYFDIYD